MGVPDQMRGWVTDSQFANLSAFLVGSVTDGVSDGYLGAPVADFHQFLALEYPDEHPGPTLHLIPSVHQRSLVIVLWIEWMFMVRGYSAAKISSRISAVRWYFAITPPLFDETPWETDIIGRARDASAMTAKEIQDAFRQSEMNRKLCVPFTFFELCATYWSSLPWSSALDYRLKGAALGALLIGNISCRGGHFVTADNRDHLIPNERMVAHLRPGLTPPLPVHVTLGGPLRRLLLAHGSDYDLVEHVAFVVLTSKVLASKKDQRSGRTAQRFSASAAAVGDGANPGTYRPVSIGRSTRLEESLLMILLETEMRSMMQPQDAPTVYYRPGTRGPTAARVILDGVAYVRRETQLSDVSVITKQICSDERVGLPKERISSRSLRSFVASNQVGLDLSPDELRQRGGWAANSDVPDTHYRFSCPHTTGVYGLLTQERIDSGALLGPAAILGIAESRLPLLGPAPSAPIASVPVSVSTTSALAITSVQGMSLRNNPKRKVRDTSPTRRK